MYAFDDTDFLENISKSSRKPSCYGQGVNILDFKFRCHKFESSPDPGLFHHHSRRCPAMHSERVFAKNIKQLYFMIQGTQLLFINIFNYV